MSKYCAASGILKYEGSTQSWSCATVPHIQILLGKNWSPRSASTTVSTGKTTTSVPRDLHRATRTQEPRYIQGQDPPGFGLQPCAKPEPQLSIFKFLLKRTGLLGIQTYRLAGETSHSQTQQDQLTPEITRWWEARASNRNQGYLASSEPSSHTTASPGYPNTPEKQDSDLKSYLIMITEEF